MPFIVKGTQNFDPAPEGLHNAVCIDVVDRGMQETPWGPSPKVEIRWQLEAVNEKNEKRHTVVKWYRPSLNEKANLRKDLEAWRGRKFTAEELAGWDLESVIGAPCQVQVIHSPREDGGVSAKVQAIVPLGKGMVKMRPQDYTRVKDRADEHAGDGAGEVASDDDIPF